jgi:hypothetical protein
MSCKHGEWHQCDACDEIDAAYKSGYEEGGKVSSDLTMKHLKRAERLVDKSAALVEAAEKVITAPDDDADIYAYW